MFLLCSFCEFPGAASGRDRVDKKTIYINNLYDTAQVGYRQASVSDAPDGL